MSTYAIIKTGGKQVKVEVGQAIYVEKLDVEAGAEVTFEEVVLVGGEKNCCWYSFSIRSNCSWNC